MKQWLCWSSETACFTKTHSICRRGARRLQSKDISEIFKSILIVSPSACNALLGQTNRQAKMTSASLQRFSMMWSTHIYHGSETRTCWLWCQWPVIEFSRIPHPRENTPSHFRDFSSLHPLGASPQNENIYIREGGDKA